MIELSRQVFILRQRLWKGTKKIRSTDELRSALSKTSFICFQQKLFGLPLSYVYSLILVVSTGAFLFKGHIGGFFLVCIPSVFAVAIARGGVFNDPSRTIEIMGKGLKVTDRFGLRTRVISYSNMIYFRYRNEVVGDAGAQYFELLDSQSRRLILIGFGTDDPASELFLVFGCVSVFEVNIDTQQPGTVWSNKS